MIKFTVDGSPFGKQRPRFARRGKFVTTYTPKETQDYEELVRLKCRQEMAKNKFKGWFNNEPIKITITAYFPILKSYSKIQKEMISKGIILPTKKPDGDNIWKAIADSLNEITYKDDSQIVEGHVFKKYGEPRVDVVIEEVKCDL